MLVAASKAHPGLAAYAVAKARKDGGHVASLSTATIEKQLGSLVRGGGQLRGWWLGGDSCAGDRRMQPATCQAVNSGRRINKVLKAESSSLGSLLVPCAQGRLGCKEKLQGSNLLEATLCNHSR
jgi:hypothetical protein